MVWVKSEYAGELAVVSAWISALVPWYVSYVPEGPYGSSVLFIRFPFVQFRYFLGLSLPDNVDTYMVTLPTTAKRIGFETTAGAYDAWMLAAVPVVLAVALSAVMYVRYERLESDLPVHPVRVMGLLLTTAGVALGVAAAQFYRLSVAGEYPFPLGVLVTVALGAVLLKVDLLEDETPTETDSADAAS